jgi:hypothetical protein
MRPGTPPATILERRLVIVRDGDDLAAIESEGNDAAYDVGCMAVEYRRHRV